MSETADNLVELPQMREAMLAERALGDWLVQNGHVQAEDLDRAVQAGPAAPVAAPWCASAPFPRTCCCNPFRAVGRSLSAAKRGPAGQPGGLSLHVRVPHHAGVVHRPCRLAVAGWEELKCIARDIFDEVLLETLDYFYPQQSIGFHLAPAHQIDRLVDFVRKERAIEGLFAGDNAKQNCGRWPRKRR